MDIQKENGGASEALKMAIAMALFKSKLIQSRKSQSHSATNADNNNAGAISSLDALPPLPPNNSHSEDLLKWKRKAKERKREILRLREDLKVAEDGLTYDVFPQNAPCKCYFYDNMAELSTSELENSSDWRFNDVLRRRFFRQVRIQERRRRRNGSTTEQLTLGTNREDEMEQLSASVDFLVELCETVSAVNMEDKKFKNWSHQAVDFILTTLKALLPMGNNVEPVEGILNSLIMRLLRRMCHASAGDAVCTQYYLLNWLTREDFDLALLEQWVASILHARKALELLENRNGLYILYIDRLIGDVAKRVGQSTFLQMLNPNILSSLFS